MSRFVLRFDDLNYEGFSWLITDTEDEKTSPQWQRASIDALSQLAKGYPTLTLVIPQQYVFLTSFELPEKASRQILSSIEYQIEEQLAQDVENQHFAIGDSSRNPLPIAVIEKSIMQDSLAQLQKHGLTATSIIPEMFLCPWFGNVGDVCLLECADGVILRYGDYQALKCQSELVEVMLDHLATEQDVQIVNYYLLDSGSFEVIKDSKYPSQQNELNLKHLNLSDHSLINLLQRQFQVTSVWSKLAAMWRWVLALLVILAVFTAFNKAIALNQLESELSAVQGAQYELLKDYLPADTAPSDDMKKAMIDLLKQSQSSANEAGFLQLLQEFTRAKTGFSTVKINKIGYQNARLSIDVTSNQLTEVEALLAVLEKSGLSAQLGKLSIKPNLISGQFVLEN